MKTCSSGIVLGKFGTLSAEIGVGDLFEFFENFNKKFIKTRELKEFLLKIGPSKLDVQFIIGQVLADVLEKLGEKSIRLFPFGLFQCHTRSHLDKNIQSIYYTHNTKLPSTYLTTLEITGAATAPLNMCLA